MGAHVVPLLRAFADVILISRKSPDCIKADLTHWDGGIKPETLKGQFDIFLHMAGLYDLRVSEIEAHNHNVVGTHSALTIAQKAEIPNFVHISTVAVGISADPGRTVRTYQLEPLRQFPDAYSATKAAAEQMVRSWSTPEIKSKLILRPGVLVGDRRDGNIQRIDGPYHAAEGLRRMLKITNRIPGPLLVPGNDHCRMPIVPVDVAADAIARLLELSWGDGWTETKCFHLAPSQGLSARDLYASALKYLGAEGRDFTLMKRIPNWMVKPAAEVVARFPQEELEYLLRFPKFDTTETEAILGPGWCPEFNEFEKAFWSGYEAFVSNR